MIDFKDEKKYIIEVLYSLIYLDIGVSQMIVESEVWKDVSYCNGLYQASNLGRIRSLDRIDRNGRKWNGKVLKASLNKDGYLQVVIYNNYKKATKQVHHLVLSAFAGTRPKGYDGCHNNGNQVDNRSVNLRWDNKKNNNADKKLHSTEQIGEKAPGAKLKNCEVALIKKLLKNKINPDIIAKMFKVARRTISHIKTGDHYTFIQSY